MKIHIRNLSILIYRCYQFLYFIVEKVNCYRHWKENWHKCLINNETKCTFSNCNNALHRIEIINYHNLVRHHYHHLILFFCCASHETHWQHVYTSKRWWFCVRIYSQLRSNRKSRAFRFNQFQLIFDEINIFHLI